MLDRRTAALALASLTAVAAAAAAGAPVASPLQEPPPAAEDAGEVAAVVALMLEAHGGRERVEALSGFDFTLTDVIVEPPTEEGGEPTERALSPVEVSLQFEPGRRRARLEESVDLGQGAVDLVRVVEDTGVQVTIDGEPRQTEQLAAEARGRTAELLLILDLSMGLLVGQVTAAPDRERTRDGVRYECLQATFAEGRGVADPFRLYVDPGTGLVRRVDQFDAATLRRKAILRFEDHVEREGIPVPGRILFQDRDGETARRWELTDVAVDPEWPEGHFAVE